MKIISIVTLLLVGYISFGQSEPSTYFNIYVPPNNTSIQRNVSLIVTAINDSTMFTIEDDGQDGDTDDAVSGILMAGQSYVLYMKDNGINDDALYASGGILKRDGDYFIINSNNLVYASMSTDSDWQHDFVPSVNKKSIGQKFYVYAPKITSSLRDLNIFAYEPGTKVTISKISTIPTTTTGYTNVDLENKVIVVDRILNPGEDIIHFYADGRNCMQTGGSYVIETNKDVSVQYGALFENARDGGGYVPSNNGSSGGNLFYFAVPYQAIGEQEIRVISWDPSNSVNLSRYSNGNWVSMVNWNLNEFKAGEWVGKQNGNVSYPTVFRVTCSPGKKVSVLEANWMETGSNATSDMATMVSSSKGTSSGTKFLAYMLPPSSQNNVVNPSTGNFFTGSISHFYLFAGSENTIVTVKDAKTNGAIINRTYQINAGRYADAFFTIAEWKSIYNGTGTTVGPDRPYVMIESTKNISVLSTNFNDNWMTYFGSSLPQSFTQTGALVPDKAIPGDTVVMTSTLEMPNGTLIENPELELNVSSGLVVVSSKLTNTENNTVVNGQIQQNLDQTKVVYEIQNPIDINDNYEVKTEVVISPSYNNADPVANGTVLSIETQFSGTVDGQFQQSILSKGVQNNAANTSNLIFSECHMNTIGASAIDAWNGAWIDYDQDGWEDLFVAGRSANLGNQLFRNNNGQGFTKVTNTSISEALGQTSASVWGDINNDGKPDVLLVNETQKRSELYLNNGNGNFTFLPFSGIDAQPQYFHGAAFADFDRDGFLDLIITNFFETRFHQLYKNRGDNTFELISNTPVSAETARSTAPILADYNNDGWVDIFIANGNNEPNSLFKNKGGFQFEEVQSGDIVTDQANSVGAAWGDYNKDGYLDLFVVNASNQNNALYRNNGDETFTSITDIAPVLDGGHSHSASWVDVNNDGNLDLYVTNDVGFKHLYLNDGLGNFDKQKLEAVAADYGAANGVAWSDYNRDGSMDFAAFTHGNEKNHLFCNNGSSNNWLSIELKGNVSNSMAIGARVAVLSGNVWQTAQVAPVSGFGSQNSLKLHFGLGTNEVVDSVIVFWPSGIKQILESVDVNDFNLVLEENSRKILGAVFQDVNQNGTRDLGEKNVANISLKLLPNGMNFLSDSDGLFELNSTDSLISFELLNASNWNFTSTMDFTFDANTDTLFVELPLVASNYETDLSVHFGTTAWRRGFENNTILTCKNEGTKNAYNVQVSMVYPEKVVVNEASMEYEISNGSTYTFTIDTLKIGESIAITLIDSVKLEATVNEILNLSATISSPDFDSDLSNNLYAEQLQIVGAIDPNDIIVSPIGVGEEGYVLKDETLTYTIRFENIGSWDATYVVINNKIPIDLDLASFEFVESSHPMTYRFENGQELIVRYDHIGLPPVSADSLGAQGYFKYRIKPRKECIGGERLYARALITFDFEEPVITNTVLSTLKKESTRVERSLFIYPNPGENWITIEIQEESRSFSNLSKLIGYRVLNANGSVVQESKILGNETFVITVADWISGTYQIEAFDENGTKYVGRIVKP